MATAAAAHQSGGGAHSPSADKSDLPHDKLVVTTEEAELRRKGTGCDIDVELCWNLMWYK